MDHQSIIRGLHQNRKTFEGLLMAQTDREILWRPAEKKWCLLEIACHLYDEEREDFRARLAQVLERPQEQLPRIDPEGWVESRDYMGKDFEQTVMGFLAERTRSVEWLQQLKRPDWKSAHHHPRFGPMSAEMFLANWLAHDFLHMRQIIRLKYWYLQQDAGDVPLVYAGEW